MIFLFLIFIILCGNVISAEVIQDKKGEFYLIKDNGEVVKLPKPKPGNKYIIKKKVIKKSNLNKDIKKARRRTNQGIR